MGTDAHTLHAAKIRKNIHTTKKNVSLQRIKTFTMKRTILIITLLTYSVIAVGQVHHSFGVSLREDLVDFSTMSVAGDSHNPYGTDYRHTFGTEFSLRYALDFDDEWAIGVSVGLMLHDYSLTGIFHSWDEPANTTNNGLFTHSQSVSHDRQTTLNLPLTADVKYYMVGMADNLMWNVIPFVSGRMGFVFDIIPIKRHSYETISVNNGTNDLDLPVGTDIVEEDTRYDRRGILWSLGIGISYGHLDIELEYITQPRHYVSEGRIMTVDATGTPQPTMPTSYNEYQIDNGDGLALRLTWNF